jgi:Family of unknown function (DUF6220)
MTWVRPAFKVLAYLFVAAIGLQFFFAGLGVLGGESMDLHETWGFTVLHLIPLLMFGLAIAGKMGRMLIGMIVVLFILVFLQPLSVDEDLEPMWLRSFHVLSGFVITVLSLHIAQRSRSAREVEATPAA